MARDQLGEIRPERYRSRYDSLGLPYSGTIEEQEIYHAQTSEVTFNGEPALLVRAYPQATIGETALYAAYVQQITGETVRYRAYNKEVDIESLPNLLIPHMSDREIAVRFEAIEGADALTETEQRLAARTALLIKTHFMKSLKKGDIARDTYLSDGI
jgi:hypothetical protein